MVKIKIYLVNGRPKEIERKTPPNLKETQIVSLKSIDDQTNGFGYVKVVTKEVIEIEEIIIREPEKTIPFMCCP